MLAKLVATGWKLYSRQDLLSKVEQLQLIMSCMKNRDTLLEKSLQIKILLDQIIVQSCIPSLEEIYFVINTIANTVNTSTVLQLH